MRVEKEAKSRTAHVAANLHDGIDVAERKIDDSIDGFSARLASLESRLREGGERVLADARDLGEAASERMRSHPLAAFGLAFAAGIVVARMLRR